MFDLGEAKSGVQSLAAHARSDAERIDAIRGLEELKCVAEAAQAALTADFADSQEAAAATRGVPSERRTRGLAHQIALARRESPHRGQRHLALARILPAELPATHAAFTAGQITECLQARGGTGGASATVSRMGASGTEVHTPPTRHSSSEPWLTHRPPAASRAEPDPAAESARSGCFSSPPTQTSNHQPDHTDHR